MKVYVTFEKNGYGDQQIEKVFFKEEDAQDHIIEGFKRRFIYDKKDLHELQELALEFIEEYNVE